MFSIPRVALESEITEASNTDLKPISRLAYPLMEAPKSLPVPVILDRIAWCESKGKHYDEHAEVLRGNVNPYDIGKYQINIRYWGNEAQKLGYDIFSEEGNEDMAIAMYEKYGTKPWYWSKKCWEKN